MQIKTTERIAEPAKTINEDVATIFGQASWVLDASSGLTGKQYTGAATDGVWFVTAWDAFLRRNIARTDLSLSSLMAQGLVEITAQFSQATEGMSFNPVDRPSCSIALVRFNSESCDYFVLGDATMILAQKNAPTTIISDRRVAQFDQQVINEMKAVLNNADYHFNDALDAVRPRLQANRHQKNVSDGYWILEFSPEALAHAMAGRIEIRTSGEVLLMTDGFAQIWDTFQIEASPENLLLRVLRTGLASAYAELKDAASKDADCRRYPRLKPLDDAGAVLVQFEL